MSVTSVGTDVVKNAVQLACRAPSLHNTQPWRWVADGAELRLFLDPDKTVISDGSKREALISCGAVLDHLRVAMAAAGWRAHVNRFPDADDANHLASIHLTPMGEVTDAHRRRADAILLRRTDRLPFIEPMDFGSFEPVLRNSLDGLGDGRVRLDLASEEMRVCLAEASQLADSLRLYDWQYHAELAWWTAPFQASEGVPYSALVSSAEKGRVDVGRAFPATHDAERRTAVPTDRSSILLLSSDDDSRTAALVSGEALSAVLLEATMAGFATCPVTHVTEVAATRDTIRACMDTNAVPQVLVRVGIAPVTAEKPPPTPRRPLDEVLRM